MLKELIAGGESVSLEFKRTIESPVKIAKTLVAFANTNGGTLLVGVEDNGAICGVSSEVEEMAKIEEASDFFCEPPLALSYQSVYEGGSLVLLIAVEESKKKPHRVKDNQGNATIYVRANNKSVQAGKTMTEILEYGEREPSSTEEVPDKNVKTLLSFLEKNESITAKRFAQLINISERRAGKLLNDLVRQGRLLIHENQSTKFYTLR